MVLPSSGNLLMRVRNSDGRPLRVESASGDIEVLDHVIVGNPNHCSLRELGYFCA